MMRCTKKQVVIYVVPVLLWMVGIFYMSHQVAEVSSEMSGEIVERIINMIFPQFENWNLERQVIYLEWLQFIIRKLAHLTEYAILGALIIRCLYGIEEIRSIDRKQWLLKAWSVGVIYAMTDEFHQLFIDGRSGQIRDVMIDSTGVAIGVVCYYCFIRVIKERAR